MDYDISSPDRLPDVCKSESYAFVALPSSAFLKGDVNADNIKKVCGSLCLKFVFVALLFVLVSFPTEFVCWLVCFWFIV